MTRGVTTIHNGIAVTTPQRTLEDLKRLVTPGELRRAIREAEFLKLPLGDGVIPDRTGNDLELAFLRLCRRYRLPEPLCRAIVEDLRSIFLWPAERLVVETDGYEAHRGAVAFEQDRRRDARLIACGYRVLRFTYWQVINEPAEVAATVRRCLRH